MDKIWHRGNIKCLHKKGLAPKDMHASMIAILGSTALWYATVKRWAVHFEMAKKKEKDSLEVDDRCGRPTTTTTEENIAHVHRVVLDDRHLTVNQIANTVCISHERLENILHNELGMLKVSAR